MVATANIRNSQFSVSSIFKVFEDSFLVGEYEELSTFGISGTLTSGGLSGNYEIAGFGLSIGLDGPGYFFNSGQLLGVTFTTAGGTFAISGFDIDALAFQDLFDAEQESSNDTSFEDLLMSFDWDISLGDGGDRITDGMTVGDGVTLNLAGDDRMDGGKGNDVLFGFAGKDLLIGSKGKDDLDGGDGADTVQGGIGDDRIVGGAGADDLKGGDGADVMLGGLGKDVLIGGRGADKLKGGAQGDALNGGRGADVLTGGGDADVFIFGKDNSRDKIKDFDAKNNAEDIDLSGLSEIKNFKDLRKNHMEEFKNGVLIDDGKGAEIYVMDVEIGQMNKGDFIF